VDVLFYASSRPPKAVSVDYGATLTTLPDSNTPSLTFTTLGSGSMDPASLDSYYIADKGWWGFSLPCICTVTGTIGNVGAGTIRTIVSGVSGSMQCTNPFKARFGDDLEANAPYASRIQERCVAGVDTGSRLGLKALAQAASGVNSVEVVAAGDLEMLRDWDPIRGKHAYGCVDIYAQGGSAGLDDFSA